VRISPEWARWKRSPPKRAASIQGLDENGVAVFCADDQWACLWRSQSRGLRMMTFGFEQAADVTGQVLSAWSRKPPQRLASAGTRFEIVLALPGQHNARNALAAATACLAAGVSLAAVQAA
jgi:UDP-N-acetylmuramoyl-tripeptide--D-alanyl-D-alanine ligase